MEFHALRCGVAALDETQPAVHIHQALVVVVVNSGTEEPDVELLITGVVHILEETPHPAVSNQRAGVRCDHTAAAADV